MNCIQGRLLSRLVVSFIAFCLVWLSQNGACVGAEQPAPKPPEAVFVTYQAERAVFSRQMSEAEAAKLSLRAGAEGGKESPNASARPNSPARAGLTWFTLVTTPQLDAVPEAKAAVERALAKWDAAFETLYPTTVRVDFGPTLFGSQFPAPNTVAVSTVPLNLAIYPELQGLLQDRTFDARQRALYDALPPDLLPTEVGSAHTIQVPAPLAKVIGIPTAAGSITFTVGFNSNNKFDFDPSDGIDSVGSPGTELEFAL